MIAAYPLHLDVRGKRVLVVGAGPVGVRRATGLAAAGAAVSVVAVDAPDDLGVPVALRSFEVGDVEGQWLVMACTGVVDDLVAESCLARGIWCVRADDAALSAAWVPAVARHDDVVVSVTAGRDPGRSVAVRDAVQLALSTGALPLRRSRPGVGSVALVGAGPGDPGLLTVRGAQLLAQADLVVTDGVLPPDGVEVVDTTGWAPQDVHELLVTRCGAGQRVVRLTAGDVRVDEVAALDGLGVTAELVPGLAAAGP